MRAHQDIVTGNDPDSPVSRGNLPATCGRCHMRAAEQFRASRHWALLSQDGNAKLPTCSTCHGEVGARLPDPEDLRDQCAQCHRMGSDAGHREYPAAAKLLLVEYTAASTMLSEAGSLIPLVADGPAGHAPRSGSGDARLFGIVARSPSG